MRVLGGAEGRVFKRVEWAGGCDVLSRSVEVTERCRRCERGVGSDELSGESGDGCEVSRLDDMDESGDGGGAKGAMGVCHKLGVGEAADREVCVIGGEGFQGLALHPQAGHTASFGWGRKMQGPQILVGAF